MTATWKKSVAVLFLVIGLFGVARAQTPDTIANLLTKHHIVSNRIERSYVWPLDSAQENFLDTVLAYQTPKDFREDNPDTLLGCLLFAPTHWKQEKRFAFWNTGNFNAGYNAQLLIYRNRYFLHSTTFYDQSNHFVEIDHFNETYGFFKEVALKTMKKRGTFCKYKVTLRPLENEIIITSMEPNGLHAKRKKPPRFHIWFAYSGAQYLVTDPFIRVLLREHNELYKEWKENPTEENTIEILKRKHAIEPIIG